MFISQAMAQASEAPGTGEMFFMNILLIVVLIGLLYFLMIRPQQKRIKEHNQMLGSLQKGEKIVTNGGLVGEIDDNSKSSEVIIDVGNKNKVTVLRSAISGRYEDIVRQNPKLTEAKNDNKEEKKDRV